MTFLQRSIYFRKASRYSKAGIQYASYIDRHYSQYWLWIHNDDMQAFLLILETGSVLYGRLLG